MQRKIIERICDMCQKSETLDKLNIHIGVVPFFGWFEVSRTTAPYSHGEKKNFDFCSEGCLSRYFLEPENRLVQVYFLSLPLKAEFYHKHKKFMKVNEDLAIEYDSNEEKIFEGHYGCMISKAKFKKYNLEEDDMRLN
jgi:hypothetical protein